MRTSSKVGQFFDPSFADKELDLIQDTLEGGADKMETGKYTKRLSEKEIQDAQKQYAYLNIEKNEVKQEMDAYLKTKKAEIKDLEERAAKELTSIKTKSEFVEGTLYFFANQEEGEMEIYDETGICTEVRPLKRDERQTTVFSVVDKSQKTA